MKVGDKVKYTKDDVEYLGLIIAKKDDIYSVSIFALGTVINTDGSDIEAL